MKQFFYLWVVCLLLFFMTACQEDGSEQSDGNDSTSQDELSLGTGKRDFKKEPPSYKEIRDGVHDFDPKIIGKIITRKMIERQERNDGIWFLNDPDDGKVLNLSLIRMEVDTLYHLGLNQYFLHGIFQEKDGLIYDVDMMMEIMTIDSVRVKNAMIHIKDGKERFTWRIVDGLYNPYQESMTTPKL